MISSELSVAAEQSAVSRNRLILVVYTAAIFVSALLLFSVQPLFTKMVLPRLGGSPAVWSVAVVFFQSLLSYPVLLEPMFTLRTQNLIWTGFYGLLIVLIASCGALLLRSPVDAADINLPDDDTDAPAPSWILRARWIFLAAVPSGLLIA